MKWSCSVKTWTLALGTHTGGAVASPERAAGTLLTPRLAIFAGATMSRQGQAAGRHPQPHAVVGTA